MQTKFKLLDQVRTVLRLKHMSFRTEEAYIGWIRRFILFHGKRHPTEMGADEFAPSCHTWQFMTGLRLQRRMSL